MGNRGCLHDDEGIIRHRWKGKRWISCVLNYKDNRVPLRKPGRYTPLFFKDEVSALAAGHRPCALCRREAYRAFVAAVERAKGLNPGSLGADDVDAMLHKERTRPLGDRRKVEVREFRDLPEGTILGANGVSVVVRLDGLSFWTWGDDCCDCVPASSFRLRTPETVIAAFQNGYVADVF